MSFFYEYKNSNIKITIELFQDVSKDDLFANRTYYLRFRRARELFTKKTNISYFIFVTSKTGNVCHCVKWFWIVLTSRMCSMSKYFVADIVETTILKIEKTKKLSWLQVNMHFSKNWKVIETSSHEICQTRNWRLQFWYSIFSETVNLGCNGC